MVVWVPHAVAATAIVYTRWFAFEMRLFTQVRQPHCCMHGPTSLLVPFEHSLSYDECALPLRHVGQIAMIGAPHSFRINCRVFCVVSCVCISTSCDHARNMRVSEWETKIDKRSHDFYTHVCKYLLAEYMCELNKYARSLKLICITIVGTQNGSPLNRLFLILFYMPLMLPLLTATVFRRITLLLFSFRFDSSI